MNTTPATDSLITARLLATARYTAVFNALLFVLSAQRGGVPKTGRRQAVGGGNDFAAALSGGRAAEHGVLAARQGEDGAGS